MSGWSSAALVAMASAWVTANRIRDFLRVVEDGFLPKAGAKARTHG